MERGGEQSCGRAREACARGVRGTLPGSAAVAAGLLLAMAGCYKSPFRTETGRTPFDQYDRRQSQHAEPYVYDAYGQRRPNLRERLRPRE